MNDDLRTETDEIQDHSVKDPLCGIVPEDLRVAARRMEAVIEECAVEQPQQWTDLAFNRHALEIFQAQYKHVEPYRAWCDQELSQREASLDEVTQWHQVPALPIVAFKHMRIAAHDESHDVATWISSGTTKGVDSRSRHHLPSLGLYEVSLLAGVRWAIVPEFRSRAPIAMQIVPSGQEVPESSLFHMFDTVREHACEDGGAWADASGRIDFDGAVAAMREAISIGRPVLLLATTIALGCFLDLLDDVVLQLPAGSRVVDTGGTKTLGEALDRADIVARVESQLGIRADHFENEYGMSELSTQSWLGSFMGRNGSNVSGHKAKEESERTGRWQPGWMRTRVVDPVTLEEVDDGEEGLLVHHDLANVWSCAVVRTEDIGIRIGDSWEYVGRAPGADLRGCSLRFGDIV